MSPQLAPCSAPSLSSLPAALHRSALRCTVLLRPALRCAALCCPPPVLFNVYVPRVGDGDRQRMRVKLIFLRALQVRRAAQRTHPLRHPCTHARTN